MLTFNVVSCLMGKLQLSWVKPSELGGLEINRHVMKKNLNYYLFNILSDFVFIDFKSLHI